MKDNERKPGSGLRDEMLGREFVQVALAPIDLASRECKLVDRQRRVIRFHAVGFNEKLCSNLLHKFRISANSFCFPKFKRMCGATSRDTEYEKILHEEPQSSLAGVTEIEKDIAQEAIA